MRKNNENIVMASFIILLITQIFLAFSEKCWHWCTIPIALCGILVAIDAVGWLRGELELLDPVGLLGLLGIHFFFLAPLLHIIWDYQLLYLPEIDDWRPWLGKMAILNFLGLLVYRFSRNLPLIKNSTQLIMWKWDFKKLLAVFIAMLIITFFSQFYIYYTFGGISGYMRSYSFDREAFAGKGWIFTISESFPLLAIMALAIFIRYKQYKLSWKSIILIFLLFIAAKFLFGGLRGSRSNTIWGILWAGAIIHLWIKPVSRKICYTTGLCLLSFMYIYGFYKSLGTDMWEVVQDPQKILQGQEETHRNLQMLLLSDLGRSEIQTYVLHRLLEEDGNYQYALGRTYLGGVLVFIPRSLWSEKLPTKVKEGTELLYGKGSYGVDFISSRVYGLAGEAMLNFGPLAVPLIYGFWGFLVGYIRKLRQVWLSDDARLLILPQLILLCPIILVGDCDNVTVFIVKQGLVPILVVWLGHTKVAVSRR